MKDIIFQAEERKSKEYQRQRSKRGQTEQADHTPINEYYTANVIIIYP